MHDFKVRVYHTPAPNVLTRNVNMKKKFEKPIQTNQPRDKSTTV